MVDARQIATGGFKQILENGRDVCDSESDSENSDHGEGISYQSAYTPEMLGPEGKPKNGAPQKLSAEEVRAQKTSAARRAPVDSAGSTTQTSLLLAERPNIQASFPLARPGRTIQVPTSSGPLALLGPGEDSSVPPKIPKKKKNSGRPGGQVTAGDEGQRVRARQKVALSIPHLI
jgi:hypothetical protein